MGIISKQKVQGNNFDYMPPYDKSDSEVDSKGKGYSIDIVN